MNSVKGEEHTGSSDRWKSLPQLINCMLNSVIYATLSESSKSNISDKLRTEGQEMEDSSPALRLFD